MPVLIVEPVDEYRKLASEIIKWADRRHRIEFAGDGSSAWTTAIERKPELILVSPDLPDITADQLCVKLRDQLPATTFIAYTNNNLNGDHAFDGELGKPPQKTAMLSYLQEAKKKRKHAVAFGSPGQLSAHRRSRAPKPPDTPFQPVRVTIGLIDEPSLRFSLNIPAGAPVGAVLRQMGKCDVAFFILMRDNKEIDATLTTPVLANDLLLIKN